MLLGHILGSSERPKQELLFLSVNFFALLLIQLEMVKFNFNKATSLEVYFNISFSNDNLEFQENAISSYRSKLKIPVKSSLSQYTEEDGWMPFHK
jgi:hypothetical protein